MGPKDINKTRDRRVLCYMLQLAALSSRTKTLNFQRLLQNLHHVFQFLVKVPFTARLNMPYLNKAHKTLPFGNVRTLTIRKKKMRQQKPLQMLLSELASLLQCTTQSNFIHTHTRAVLPFQVYLGEPVLSQSRDLSPVSTFHTRVDG